MRPLSAYITLIFALLTPVSVSSQTPTDSVYRMLEELNVVAVKQQRDISRIAVTGNIVDEATIERDRIADIKGISGMVPNFFIPDYGSRITSSIYVRGIGARMDQPAVGLNIDNVGILNKDAYDFDIEDIVSIEMLRGPQSSLYGRNTMTGLISIRTLSPMEFQGWRFGAELASGRSLRLNAGWYHRFNSSTGLGVSAAFQRSSGRFRNEYNGALIDGERNGSLRLKFHWAPSSKVTITNTLASSLLRQGGYPYEYAETGMINYNDTCFYRRFLLSDGLTVRARLGRYELLSVTSLQHINDNMTLDQDFLPDPYFTLTQKKRETALTEDLMLRGEEADGKYRWLTGVYAFFRHMSMNAPVTFKETGIEHLIVANRNKANPYYPIRWDEDSFRLNSDFKSPSGGIAAYHESTFNLGRWRLTGALRLDFERVNLHYDSYCRTSYTTYLNPSGSLPMAPGADVFRHNPVDMKAEGDLHRQYFMALPRFSALYDLTAVGSKNVYVSAGRGYKAGGFNTQMFSDVLQQKLMEYMGLAALYDVDDIVGYKPEKSWTFEIGTHLLFPKSNLRADASLFYIHCVDQQLTTFPDGKATGRMMTNAGKTRSFGGELSLGWNPIESLMLTANYGYTNARFIDYDNGKQNFKGKRLPYAPSNTLYVAGCYTLTGRWLRSNALQFNINCNASGDIYWNEENTLRQPLYALLGASVTFLAPKWSLELWGTNLTDTRYHTFSFMSMGNSFFQRGNPASIGLRASLTL